MFERRRRNCRKAQAGVTLIEMLVVMGIILLLATLGVAYLPKMSDNQKRTRAVDLVSQWLLTAKERKEFARCIEQARSTMSHEHLH